MLPPPPPAPPPGDDPESLLEPQPAVRPPALPIMWRLLRPFGT
jgi:hypothetical protein